jgi:hypothetical protein
MQERIIKSPGVMPIQKTCSTAGPLCIINSSSVCGQRFRRALPIHPPSAYTRFCVRPMLGYPHRGGGGEGSMARRGLDAALNAEFLLDIFDAVERVLKFLLMHHLITQAVYVCLDPSHARVKVV